MTNKFLRGSFWVSAEKLFRFAIGFGVFSYMAKMLGASQFGYYSLAVAFYGVFFAMAPLGTSRQAVRELCLAKANVDRLYTQYLMFRVVAALSMALASWVILLCMNVQSPMYWIVFALCFVFSEVQDCYSQATESMEFITLFRFFAFLVAATARLLVVSSDLGMFYLLASIALEPVLMACCVVTYGFRRKLLVFTFSASSFAKFAWQRALLCWPELVSAMCAILYMKIDIFFIQGYLGSKDVGVYSVAVKLCEIWYFLPAAIVAITFPSAIRLLESSRNGFILRITQLTSLLFWLGVLYYIFINMMTNWFVQPYFGEEYGKVVILVAMLALGGLFVGMGLASGSWLHAEGRLKYAMWRNIVALVMNMILNFSLVPHYGSRGAAVATVISLFVAFFLFDILVRGGREMFWVKVRAMNPAYALSGIRLMF